MSEDEKNLLIIRGTIAFLPAAQKEACDELVDHIRMLVRQAGSPVGPLALALVDAEMAAREE